MATVTDARQLTEELITENRDGLLAFFLGKGLQRADAEDLAQGVFVRAVQWVQGDNKPLHNPKAWLWTTAKNLLIDYWKHREVQRKTFEETPHIDRSVTSTSSNDLFLNSRTVEMVRNGVNSLSPLRRAVVVSWMEGFTQKEIAAKMSLSQRTVQRRLIAVCQQLREQIQNSHSE
jgi:RNA polymerase sigma factor (sigma-70 family)